MTNGVISNFQPKTAFHALNYNDKPEISGWGMPSDKYIDLTLGVHGTTYTAPANGYFAWAILTKEAGDYCYGLYSLSKNLSSSTRIAQKEWAADVFVPAEKGDLVQMRSDGKNVGGNLRFIYAEGSK